MSALDDLLTITFVWYQQRLLLPQELGDLGKLVAAAFQNDIQSAGVLLHYSNKNIQISQRIGAQVYPAHLLTFTTAQYKALLDDLSSKVEEIKKNAEAAEQDRKKKETEAAKYLDPDVKLPPMESLTLNKSPAVKATAAAIGKPPAGKPKRK